MVGVVGVGGAMEVFYNKSIQRAFAFFFKQLSVVGFRVCSTHGIQQHATSSPSPPPPPAGFSLLLTRQITRQFNQTTFNTNDKRR